jgi:integrase
MVCLGGRVSRDVGLRQIIGPRPLTLEPFSLGAEYDEPFLASLIPGRVVKTFSRHTLRKRFRTSCKILGAARLETLTIHHGRHTFISHSLAGGRTLAEVRDAAGHCNVSITSGYLHVAVEDEAAVGSLFHLE